MAAFFPVTGHLTRWLRLFLLLLPAAAFAQPTWQGIGTLNPSLLGGSSTLRASAPAANGQLYVAGEFSGRVAFGSNVVQSTGGTIDAFLAKFDPATHTWLWVRTFGNSGTERITALTAAPDGRVYTGFEYTTGSLTFGANTLSSGGFTDAGVALYTESTNTWRWGLAISGSGNQYVASLALRGQTVYVGGRMEAPATQFGAITLTVGRGYGGYVARLTDNTTSAAWTWATKPLTDELYCAVTTLIPLNTNEVAVGGEFNGAYVDFWYAGTAQRTLSAGGVAGTKGYLATLTDNVTSPSWRRAVLLASGASQNPNGTIGSGAVSHVSVRQVVVRGGQLYATGVFRDDHFALGSLAAPDKWLVGAKIPRCFVLRVDATTRGTVPTFTPRWADYLGGVNDVTAGLDNSQVLTSTGLAVDAANVYVVGESALYDVSWDGTSPVEHAHTMPHESDTYYASGALAKVPAKDVFVLRLTEPTATSVVCNSLKLGGGAYADLATSITLTGSRLCITGRATDGTGYGASTVGGNAAVTTMNPATDAWVGAEQILENHAAAITQVARGAAGDVYVAGTFSGSLRLGATTAVSLGRNDVFVAKWSGTANSWQWVAGAGSFYDDLGDPRIARSPDGVFLAYIKQVYQAPWVSQDFVLTRLVDNGTGFTPGATANMSFLNDAEANEEMRAFAANGTRVYLAGYARLYDTNGGLTGNGFLMSYDFGTNTSWAQALPINNNGIGRLTATTTGGYLSGTAAAGDTFGSYTAAAGDFLTKADPATGSYQWLTQNPWHLGLHVASGSGTALYVTGTHTAGQTVGGTTFGTAGAHLGQLTETPASPVGLARAIAVPGGGQQLATEGPNVYLASPFTGSVQVGATTLTAPAGTTALYVARLTDGTSLSWKWALSSGGTDSKTLIGLVAAANNDVYVVATTPAATSAFGALSAPGNSQTLLAHLLGPASAVPVAPAAPAPARVTTAAGGGQALGVWPNPASATGSVQVALPAGATGSVALYDLTGRLVVQAAAAGSRCTLPLPGLTTGTYVVRAGAQACRLVVE